MRDDHFPLPVIDLITPQHTALEELTVTKIVKIVHFLPRREGSDGARSCEARLVKHGWPVTSKDVITSIGA